MLAAMCVALTGMDQHGVVGGDGREILNIERNEITDTSLSLSMGD
jgi:hypothetical protein